MRALFIALMLFTFVPLANYTVMAEEIYTCPMHPHVQGEKGEDCPICGMTLVPKAEEKPSMSMPGMEDDMSSPSKQDTPIHIDENKKGE